MEEWQNPQTIAIWSLIALFIVILLGISIVILVRLHLQRMLKAQQKIAETKLRYQQQLLKDSVQIQERERNRIASDLHDELIGQLNVVLYAQYNHPQSTILLPQLQTCIATARRISHDLSPPLLLQTSLQEWITELIYPLREAYHINTYFNITSSELHIDIKLQIIRIVQETISNILKHSKADSINLMLRVSHQLIAFKIEDNGLGFNPEDLSNGLGLKNIELRAQLTNGTYKFKTPLGGGTTFLFTTKQTK